MPSSLVLGKDINRMEELFYKIFVLNDFVFSTFCFFFLWRLHNIGHCLLHEVEIKVVFILEIYWFLPARFFMIADFKMVIEFTYSYAIHEKIAVRAISVFQEEFDVEFSRQAVTFSV